MRSDANEPELKQGARGRWRVGEACVDLDLGTVASHGACLTLRRKTLLVLRALLDEPGRVVERDRLIELVWPGLWVVDDSLTQCIRELRRALGPEAGRHLVTLRGRGYLLRDTAQLPACEPVGAPLMADRVALLEARIAALEALLQQPLARVARRPAAERQLQS
jgi:DNA-binding winged helix-turn-helix (wHTH) protein